MRRIFRLLVILVVVAFALAQAARPRPGNPTTDPDEHLFASTSIDEGTKELLARSCFDCHSNQTRWPFYSHIAPVAWSVVDHVEHGRRHLNFSSWSTMPEEKQLAALKDICSEVKEGEMPFASYTLVHRSARLSATDIETLCRWSRGESGRLARKEESGDVR
ncbi:MAG TPA: heme-binding domain-containing protein [Thermoanaerobaculia bacterium]|nr:heme-binding domain-containing protein [Thermoanaerobaculia bacterium]